jgi:anti-sigma factor ChrR (cupin superfamily)
MAMMSAIIINIRPVEDERVARRAAAALHPPRRKYPTSHSDLRKSKRKCEAEITSILREIVLLKNSPHSKTQQ